MQYPLTHRLLDYRDRLRASPVVDRAMSIRVDAPRRLTTYILAGVVLVLLFWVYGRAVERATNDVWREKIAASSAEIRAVLAAGETDITATDTAILAKLREQDDKLRAAEAALRSTIAPSDGCVPIPRHCLRLGGM